MNQDVQRSKYKIMTFMTLTSLLIKEIIADAIQPMSALILLDIAVVLHLTDNVTLLKRLEFSFGIKEKVFSR